MRDNNCPCNGCTERKTACSDDCPKDSRGEYGHKAWLAEVHKEEAEENEWRKLCKEDSKRDARYGFTTRKRR